MSLCPRHLSTTSYADEPLKFPDRVKIRPVAASEVDPVDQSGLMALEIVEVEGSAASRRTPPRLDAPRGGQPRALRELDVGGRADKQRLAGQFVEAEILILSQISRLTAEQDIRANPRHHSRGDANSRFLLGKIGMRKTGPL